MHGNIHLTKRAGNLGPDSVNVIVERLQSEDLQLGLFVSQEAENAGCCDETWHFGENATATTRIPGEKKSDRCHSRGEVVKEINMD